jgi:ribosomal protein S18 acetylase RimI-like enzyme
MIVRQYIDSQDRGAVIALWKDIFGYSSEHNEPSFVIDQKIKENDSLFFVASDGERIVGTVIAGYDGHRGWIYSMAVAPELRRRGIGGALMRHAEDALSKRGCAKVNLQVVDTNPTAVLYYESLGYKVEARISMGKRLKKPNSPPTTAGT